MIALGLFVAPFWMGTYLYVSINWFGRHRNEAFSALRIADWKNFLRMQIDKDGRLRIFPVGIERVPRKGKKEKGTVRPDDPAATEPELMEAPIVIE